MSTEDAARLEDKRALIAVDLGAESCRVSLLRWIDGSAHIHLVHRFANAPEQRVDGLRWNLRRIVDGVEEGLQKCAFTATEGVRSIAVDGWAVDYVRLAADGAALEDPFCYRDPRCEAAQTMFHRKISAEQLRERTGVQIQPLNTVYQLYADRLASVASSRWLNIPEYMLYCWSGAAVAERTNATHTGLVDLDGNWCGEILAAAEVPLAHAPRIVEPGTWMGTYAGDVAALRGVNVIAPCCHDTASAVAGIPAEGEDWAYISSGTWSLIGTLLDQACNTREASDENFTNLGAAGGRILFHKGIAGMWLLRQCMAAWKTEDVTLLVAQAGGVSAFASEELIDVEDASLAQPGEMPERINAQRARRGLPSLHQRAELVRLIFDSLATHYAAVLRSIEQITGRKLRRIYIVGGGSQNALLNRLTAEATGLEVRRGAVESSTIGNFAVQLAAGEDDASAARVARWAARLAG